MTEAEEISSKIDKFYVSLATRTGMKYKDDEDVKYRETLCRAMNQLEQQLIILALRGIDINPNTIRKLNEIKKFTCEP